MDPTRERKGKMEPYKRKIIAVVVALVFVVAGFSIFYSLENRAPKEKTIVVYTYSSFMADGLNKTAAYNIVFGTFEKEYHVNIVVEYPKNGLLSTLESQKSSPKANIVIGLTNINGVEAARDGLLVKYSPPDASYINSTLLNEMGCASSYLTPYEYSYLGIDYNKTGPSGSDFHPTFSDLLNSENVTHLLLENPITSETGQGFLLWEISYYEYVLHENWTRWWNASLPYLGDHVYDSWSSAFTFFESAPANYLLLSYLTDPAYNAYFGYGNSTGSTVTYHDGNEYGWRTIYSIGIVNGSSYEGLSEDFVNYFLGGTVQGEIPLNEWMYPANSSIPLPSVYNVTMRQTNIIPLNNFINATVIYDNIQNWETEWLDLSS